MSTTSSAVSQPGNYAQANGIQIYYEDYGRGEALIFLHGSLGTGRVWHPYISSLAQDFHLIIPDLRGHGKTENPVGAINLHLLSDDTAALIAALHLEKAYLCGWSMGGDIGLDVAIRYPELVSGLVVGGVTYRISDTYFASLQAMGLEGPGQINVEQAQKSIPQLVALWQAEHRQNPSHWQELAAQLSGEMLNPTPPADEDLRQIRVPTLLVWGDRDQFLPVEDALALYRLLPEAQLAVIPGADHFVSRTRVELFAALVRGFLLSR